MTGVPTSPMYFSRSRLSLSTTPSLSARDSARGWLMSSLAVLAYVGARLDVTEAAMTPTAMPTTAVSRMATMTKGSRRPPRSGYSRDSRAGPGSLERLFAPRGRWPDVHGGHVALNDCGRAR